MVTLAFNGQRTPFPFVHFHAVHPDTRTSLASKRVLPCVFDPANGSEGCGFYDADKLLHATPHCPLASSHLMSVSSSSSLTAQRPTQAVILTTLLLALVLSCSCLATNDCSWKLKQKTWSVCWSQFIPETRCRDAL